MFLHQIGAAPYHVSVQGGVSPYNYTWDMGSQYQTDPASCPNSPCGSQCEFTGMENQRSGTFSGGNIPNKVFVTVTDAVGGQEIVSIETKVTQGLQPLEFYVNGDRSCGEYKTGSLLLFSPDIDPLSSLEAPVTYVWNFGDGTIVTDDSYGNQGIVTHTFQPTATPFATYPVTLTVTDQNGTIQASKLVSVCTPGASGGGGTNPNCAVGQLYGSGYPILSYGSTNSSCTVALYGTNGCNSGSSTYKWTFSMDDCGVVAEPELVSNNSSFDIDIDNADWNNLTNNNRPWGKVNVTCVNKGTGCGCTGPSTNLFYIKPPKLVFEGVSVVGACEDYKLVANVSGGAWKMVNGVKTYKDDFTWKAFKVGSNFQEEIQGVFLDANLNDNEIHINPEYIKNFDSNAFIPIDIEVRSRDYANQEVVLFESIIIDAFRLHLKDTYFRCPGSTSAFENNSFLVTGAAKNAVLTYTWSGGLSGPNPEVTAPLTGFDTYSLTVSDGVCTLSTTTKIITKPLSLSLPAMIKTCASIKGNRIGPSDAINIGGSGEFYYQWNDNAGGQYLSYLHWSKADRNPQVNNLPAGTSVIYTLLITDKYGGCTATASTTVTSVANTIAINLPTTHSTCNGDPLEIVAKLQGSTVFPQGYTCEWTYPGYPRPDRLKTGATPNIMVLDELAATYAGDYPFKAKVTQAETGCFAEATTQVRILGAWKHKGYEPDTWFSVNGTTQQLWAKGDNRLLVPNPNSSTNKFDVTWQSGTPFGIQAGTSGIPSNGGFIPTVQQPQLSMDVTHIGTGCKHTYKTINYLIGDSNLDLKVMTDQGGLVCKNESVCFDVLFNMHLLPGQKAPYLPQFVQVKYRLDKNITQLITSGTMNLELKNSAGLYQANICLNDYFVTEDQYSFEVELLNAKQFGAHIWHPTFNQYVVPTIMSGMEFQVSDGIYSPIQTGPWASCLPPSSEVGLGKFNTSIKVGINNSTCFVDGSRIVDWKGTYKVAEFFEIQPIAGLIFQPDSYYRRGIHVMVDPCQPPGKPEALSENDKTASIRANSKDLSSDGSKGKVSFEIQPNPYDDYVRLSYLLTDIETVQSATLRLYDFSGRFIQVIEEFPNIQSGYYATTFNTNQLAPGIYFYELQFSDGRTIVKRGVKQ